MNDKAFNVRFGSLADIAAVNCDVALPPKADTKLGDWIVRSPLLRLQYFDQPIGEFLHVGMKPISMWRGDPAIFVLVNGGAGLVLIGQNGSANVEIPATSRFLFVRPRALAKEP